MISADLILADLEATSKKQVFRHLAERTAALFEGDAEALQAALFDREKIGPTGIGDGVAIPHIKACGITRMYGVLARLQSPVDFDALDGVGVDIIFMLLAPAESKTTQHLKTLALISRFLKDTGIRRNIREAKSEDDIARLVLDWAEEHVT